MKKMVLHPSPFRIEHWITISSFKYRKMIFLQAVSSFLEQFSGRRVAFLKKFKGIAMIKCRLAATLTALLLALGSVISGTAPAEAGTPAGCPPNIASYWYLDETSGRTFLDSVSGNNASCANTPDCPAFSVGKIGNALLFDGIDDALTAPALSFNWGQGDSFTIEFWMKTDPANSCDGNAVIVGRNDSATRLVWWVGCRDITGLAAFQLSDKIGNTAFLQGTTPLTDGQWHHIAVVKDGGAGENRLYVDGVLESAAATGYTAGFDSAAAELTIGWLNLSSGHYFSGLIDELAIYNRALLEGEIAQHFNDGVVGLGWGYCGCGITVRIMPIGDSITLGKNPLITDNNYMVGYRKKLYEDLISQGSTVDFVGSLHSGDLACPACDNDHEGHAGFHADGSPAGNAYDILDNVYSWLAVNPADVVMLHIGTTDVSSGGQSAGEISAILDQIYSANPAMSVILARIINRIDTGDGKFQTTTQYNIDLQNMANARIAAGDKLQVVDQESVLTYPADMEDTLHPTQAGYDKMASPW
ncbi:MAG: GDSL-type esterase/lipase family protein, partial [Nitrospirota bacterium]|nr:GDSL-type esterase/lipase family protein [Nitrospirota bacterium]